MLPLCAAPEGHLCTMCVHLLSLELDHRISKQVSDVKLSPLLNDIWMLANQQPPDVGEEEASARIVGVRICLRVLVVGSVVPGPLEDVILQRECRARVKGQNAWCCLGSCSASPS